MKKIIKISTVKQLIREEIQRFKEADSDSHTLLKTIANEIDSKVKGITNVSYSDMDSHNKVTFVVTIKHTDSLYTKSGKEYPNKFSRKFVSIKSDVVKILKDHNVSLVNYYPPQRKSFQDSEGTVRGAFPIPKMEFEVKVNV